jgi:tight adherence protein C
MSAGLILLWFMLAVAGIALAGFGATMMLADRRIEARLSRITLSSRPAWHALRLPSFLTARGRDRDEILEKLRIAGFQGHRALERFLWIRAGATIGAALLTRVFAQLVWGDFLARPWLALIAAALTYIGTKLALNMFATSRTRTITAEFPFLLDLMLMMLESGVSLDQCFRSIAREEASAAPRLTRSLGVLVADLDRGMSYEGALDRWASRVAVKGATELASLFRQGLFQGVELSPALREFVRDFTERRIATAREAIGRITVQMIVVMILFFLPALFIVLGGPPLASLSDTLKDTKK